MAAILLRRACSSLIPIAARSRESSPIPLIISSAGSSSLVDAAGQLKCSSVLSLRNRLFGFSFLPISTSSSSRPSCKSTEMKEAKFLKMKEAKFRKMKEPPFAIPEDFNKLDTQFPKTGKFNLCWRSKDDIIEIQAVEKVHDKEHSLLMHIKFVYGDKFSNRMEFDVALPDDQGHISIQNATESVGEHFLEYFQEHLDTFEGLLVDRGFSQIKFEFVVKCAEKLKAFNKCLELNTKSVSTKYFNSGNLTLYWRTEDEIIEVEVEEKMHDSETVAEQHSSLQMLVKFLYGDKFCKRMVFEIAIPDDQSQVDIQEVTMSVDEYDRSQEYSQEHLDGFTGLLENRGFNHSIFGFVVEYARKLKECKMLADLYGDSESRNTN